MKTYYLTVYNKTGENLLNDSFEAKNDEEAKEMGKKTLEEKQFNETTHRLVSPEGKLLLFHR